MKLAPPGRHTTPVSQTLTFISRFLITDSAALADLCVGFPLPGIGVMIQDVAAKTASQFVVQGVSSQETLNEGPLLRSKV